MTRCKKCGKEFQIEIKGFCSNSCYESDLQERVQDACSEDTTHTKKMS